MKKSLPKKASSWRAASAASRVRVNMVSTAWHGALAAVQHIFLTKNTWLEMAILLVAGAVSSVILYQLLFQVPHAAELPIPSRDQELVTPVIDDLELWIEERQTTYLTPTVVPSRVFRQNEP